MSRNEYWMETFTGKKFWPLDPRIEDVGIEDIAHALSLICRFGGQCREFYSVAQHSCLVADIVLAQEPQYALAALVHDAAEAYIGDVIRPIKRGIPELCRAEEQIERLIAKKFGTPFPIPAVVKWADNVMLRNEHAQLMHGRNRWPSCDQADGPDVNVMPPWLPGIAESMFIRKYETLACSCCSK